MLEAFKVEIADATVKTVDSEPNERTGEIKRYPTQTAYLHKPGAKYPIQFRLYVPGERKGRGYEPGMYAIDPSSAYTGGGKLQFSLNKLIPLGPAKA